uniref:Transmembrane protein 229B-like n=1 Tax=Astyanax mexicanus TaxID=7994 RepID=A0A3B1KA38_ASTMX
MKACSVHRSLLPCCFRKWTAVYDIMPRFKMHLQRSVSILTLISSWQMCCMSYLYPMSSIQMMQTVRSNKTEGCFTDESLDQGLNQGPGADIKTPPNLHDQPALALLSPLARLYIYALHGCVCEVVFTAAWNWYYTRDRRLSGYTSLWALLIYSSAIFIMEFISAKLHQRHCPLLLRLAVYILFIYLWEFSWGFMLRLLQACPWDYSDFRYNLIGLVTLEYAVPWALAAFLAEQHVIKNTLKIRMDGELMLSR